MNTISLFLFIYFLFIWAYDELSYITFRFNYQSMKKPHKWELHLHTANEDKL